MFDGIDSIEACGDLFYHGVNNDHLELIKEANKEIIINVKTPHGKSIDFMLKNGVLQEVVPFKEGVVATRVVKGLLFYTIAPK